LKNSRNLFGEFKIHRIGRRAPQGNDGYRALVNNVNHTRRHLAAPFRGALE
jgi:hypothetical protein